MEHSRQELLVAVVARLLDGTGHVAVGASSPIPGAGAFLHRALSADRVRVSVLGSRRFNFFTDGGREMFDCAAQGRIDAFFLGGGQIDGEGNINLVGVGDYPSLSVRWPGSFGSSYLYFMIPRVILFREEHTPRVFVPKVDFVSAPGVSEPGVWRRGGPRALLTGRALFSFDKEARRFRLESVHEGETLSSVTENTGFEFDHGASVPETAPPDTALLALIRGRVRGEIAETYPDFAEQVLGSAA
jgi:glutaconate CoA-transferase subunit B